MWVDSNRVGGRNMSEWEDRYKQICEDYAEDCDLACDRECPVNPVANKDYSERRPETK